MRIFFYFASHPIKDLRSVIPGINFDTTLSLSFNTF